jgi:D-serine deaminase-like pyridoxal phosphate-dependent protein
VSEPFERTTRYLSADSGGLARAGVSAGLIIFVLWLGWLFFAQVPVYVQSQRVQLGAAGVYSVSVDRADAGRVKPGQAASLQPNSALPGDAAVSPLAATVVSVDPQHGLVQISLQHSVERPAGGTVWIITEQITPATMLLRAVEHALTSP